MFKRAAIAFLLALVTLASAQQSYLVPPMRWAMVIGANTYPHFGDLSFAANDAKSFKTFLEENLSYSPKNVAFVVDGPDSTLKPTAKNITKELDRLLGDPKLNKSDLFIFYFAGHGVGTPKADYLLPADADKNNVETSGLPVRRIIDRLVAAKLRNVLIVADACRTGADNSFGRELTDLTRETNICLILGTQPNSRSYEYPQLQHGVFTYCLLKALKNPENLDKETGALWASKVAKDTSTLVQEYTKRDYPEKPQTPTSWVETRKDVLLKLEPTGVIPPGLTADFAKLSTDEKERYALYLLALAEVLIKEKNLNQSLQVLQALDAVSPDDERIGYLMASCALKLGRFGLADRMRTKVLQKKVWGRYADDLALVPGTFQVAPADFQRAFANSWQLLPWDGRYYILAVCLQSRILPQLDYDLYFRELLEGAKGDPRRSNAALGLQAKSKADDPATAAFFLEAIKHPGDVPRHDTLVQAIQLAHLNMHDQKAADDVIVREARDNRLLLLESTRILVGANKIADAKETLKRYFKLGISPEDISYLIAACGASNELCEMLEKEIAPFQDADWRVKLTKIVLKSTLHGGSVLDHAKDLLEVLIEFKEERVLRVTTSLGMFYELANCYPELERFNLYNGLFSIGILGLADADGYEPFWQIFRTVAENCNYHFFFANFVDNYLLDSPNLPQFDPQNLIDIHQIYLQTGHEDKAPKIAKVIVGMGAKSRVLWNEATEYFAFGDDALTEKKLEEIRAAKDTLRLPTYFQTPDLLAEFYAAKREKRAMRLTEIQQRFGPPKVVAKICEMELRGHDWTDKDVDDAYALPNAVAYATMYARLFAHVKFEKLSSEGRAKMVNQLVNYCQVMVGLKVISQIVIKPGSKVSDYAMKLTGTFPVRLNNGISESKIVLTIDASGKATGSFKFGPDPDRPIEGTVDANGNLDAIVKHDKGTLKVMAKLWPLQDPDCKAAPACQKLKLTFYTPNGDFGFGYLPIDPSKS